MGENPGLLTALLAALGLGLLIGTVRERQQPHSAAGLRTHGLVALLAAVALWLTPLALVVMLLALSGLVLIDYRRSRVKDPGLTGEVTLLLTALLGGLALQAPSLAAGLGVLTAILLFAKVPLHRFSREVVSERELQDGLVLLASALVVLPLLPDHPLGPYDSFNPSLLWRLVVLVMAISALGHVALRVVGARWGLALAGFFAGYVSSTAAIAGFGQRVRDTPAMLRPAVGAAMFACLASLTLLVPVLLAVVPAVLPAIALELLAAGAVLLVGGLLGLGGGASATLPAPTSEARMFQLGQALLFAAVIAAVLFVSALMNAWLGARGALVAAMIAALAELHAAAASVAQLYGGADLSLVQVRWGFVGLLAASVVSRGAVAAISGGRAYGGRVAVGLVLMLAAAAGTVAVQGWVRA